MEQDQTAFIASGYVHSAYRQAVSVSPAKLEVGQKMPDGTIYAGVSPDEGLPMFATAQGHFRRIDFWEAERYAKTLNAHGHGDYRVPTIDELDVLYENRNKGALKDTFKTSAYWSSSEPYTSTSGAWYQSFNTGAQGFNFKYIGIYVRCVRSGESFNH